MRQNIVQSVIVNEQMSNVPAHTDLLKCRDHSSLLAFITCRKQGMIGGSKVKNQSSCARTDRQSYSVFTKLNDLSASIHGSYLDGFVVIIQTLAEEYRSDSSAVHEHCEGH